MSTSFVNKGFFVRQEPLKKLKMALRFILSVLLCWLVVYGYSGLWAAKEQTETWSFQFTNASISDVLDELTKVTGINIFTNKVPEKKVLTKSYKDQTIDEIIKDVFRGVNHAVLWHHSEKGVDGVDIWILDGSPPGASRNLSNVARTNPRNLSSNPASRILPERRNQDPPENEPEDEDEPEEEEEPEEEQEEQSTSPPPNLNPKSKRTPTDPGDESSGE